MAERRETSQLIGDALREIAVLVAVFFPLECILNWLFHSGTIDWWVIAIVLLGAAMIHGFGIILEGRDEL